jgi:hypothetical protein
MGGMGGGGMGGMGGGGMQQGPGAGGKEKKEGPAEAAPKDKQALQPIEPVPAQPRGLRQLQLFELHGYMRMRADYFHRLDLGLGKGNQPVGRLTYNQNSAADNKFFPPPAVANETIDGAGQPIAEGGTDANCFGTLLDRGINSQQGRPPLRPPQRLRQSANMRLRMEPTLHITDTVKVHATIDALDNLVLGSTPDSFLGDNPFAPIDLYTRTQNPPSAGRNSFTDSLVVKRAYGHIRFGWGLDIKFGRMPHHWGMGLVANDGNGYYRGDKSDIVRQLDMDYGDSVDSLRLGFDFGKDRRNVHTLEASWDWASSRPDHLAAARPVVELRQPRRPGLQRRALRQRLPVAPVDPPPRRPGDAAAQARARPPRRQLRRDRLDPQPGRRPRHRQPRPRRRPRHQPDLGRDSNADNGLGRHGSLPRQRRPRRSRRQRHPELRQPPDPPPRPHRSPPTCGSASTGRPSASSSRPPACSAA